MERYGTSDVPDPFGCSMEAVKSLAARLSARETAELDHAAMEYLIEVDGREILRRFFQDHLCHCWRRPVSGWLITGASLVAEDGHEEAYPIRAFTSLEEHHRQEEAFYDSAARRNGPREAIVSRIDSAHDCSPRLGRGRSRVPEGVTLAGAA